MFYRVLILLFISKTLCDDLQMCDRDNSLDITEGHRFPNGDILFNGVTYKKNEYYVDETGSVRGCDCTKQKCVRKCCPNGFGFVTETKMCVNVNGTFDPPIWDEYKLLAGMKASQLFHFVPGVMNCTLPERRIQVGQRIQSYHMRSDGKIFIEMKQRIPPWIVQDAETYCIDNFVTDGPNAERSTHLDVLLCIAPKQESHDIMTSTCMLISCVFIIATVAVYAWLPELRNLHGRVLMAYLLCLFVAFAFMATMQILLKHDNISSVMCIATTFVIYFSLESAFFWLNVMCFDIWWTFSGKRGLSLGRLSMRARFAAYSAYAFGVPTALTIVLASLEFSGLPLHPLLPMIKHQGCFIFGKSKLLYLYGPIVILWVVDIVFFILTAVKLAQIKRQTSVLNSKESSMHDQQNKDRQRLLLYAKLFAVMGINWILEVISAIFPEADFIFRFIDAYNVLIGLMIFIIFVCKRKIFQLIKKRYKQVRGDPISRIQTTATRTTLTQYDMSLGSIRKTVKTAGDATSKGENLKRLKYTTLGGGYICEPYMVETLGESPGAHRLYDDLSKLLVEGTRDQKAGMYLGQGISIAIQRGNVASHLGTLPTGNDV